MIELHFLPYGRVDAVLIGVDGQHWAFVDGGYRRDGKKSLEYMRGLGITRLDAYIASHRHRNHVGAGPVVIEAMRPKDVYCRDPEMKDRLLGLCKSTEEERVIGGPVCMEMGPGESFKVGEAVFTCIGPGKLKKCTSGAYAENQNSLILRVEYKGRSILLTGDTAGGILWKMPDEWLRAEVLKNPHHNGALGEKILKRIKPDITVVCNGKPPAKYYRKRLDAIGSKLYTAGTKGNGLVVLEGDENGWRVRPTFMSVTKGDSPGEAKDINVPTKERRMICSTLQIL